jgi:hypothetical protein
MTRLCRVSSIAALPAISCSQSNSFTVQRPDIHPRGYTGRRDAAPLSELAGELGRLVERQLFEGEDERAGEQSEWRTAILFVNNGRSNRLTMGSGLSGNSSSI